MKAKYNRWYRCKKGQMPEDFENIPQHVVNTCTVLITLAGLKGNVSVFCDYRNKAYSWRWANHHEEDVIAWMLPRPYNEKKWYEI